MSIIPPNIRQTYAGELDAAVTALGRGGELFDVVVAEDAARGLHHATAVALRVVRLALAEGDTLGHCCSANNLRTYIQDRVRVSAYRLKGKTSQRFSIRSKVRRA